MGKQRSPMRVEGAELERAGKNESVAYTDPASPFRGTILIFMTTNLHDML